MNKNSKIAILGGSRMIGTALKNYLYKNGYQYVYSPIHEELDVLDIVKLKNDYTLRNAEYVFNLLSFNGNPLWLKENQSDVFRINTQMNLNVLNELAYPYIEYSRDIEKQTFCMNSPRTKIISIIPSCAYPDKSLLKESEFLDGSAHPSVSMHGHARRNTFEYSKYLYNQYGVNAICVVANNSYGPHDSFDEGKTKVVGGIIKRFVGAKLKDSPEVVCWGTGTPRRELTFCDDVAEGLVKAAQLYNDPTEVLNIANRYDISIKGLAEIVAETVGYKGKISWDVSKGDGQMVKKLSQEKMLQALNWEPSTKLEDGIKKTVDWYYNSILRK